MKKVRNLMIAGLAVLAVASCKKEANLPSTESETIENDGIVTQARTISPEFENIKICTEMYQKVPIQEPPL